MTSSIRSTHRPCVLCEAEKLLLGRSSRRARLRPACRRRPCRLRSVSDGFARRRAVSTASSSEAVHGRRIRRKPWEGTALTTSIESTQGRVETAAARRAPRGPAKSSRPRCLSDTITVRRTPSCSPQITVARCGGGLSIQCRHSSELSSVGVPHRGQAAPPRGTTDAQHMLHRPRSLPANGWSQCGQRPGSSASVAVVSTPPVCTAVMVPEAGSRGGGGADLGGVSRRFADLPG